MAKRRLNKTIREKVIESVLKTANEKREQKLVEREHKLAKDLVLSIIDEHYDTFMSLPERFFPSHSSFDVRIDFPENKSFTFIKAREGYTRNKLKSDQSMRVPASLMYGHIRIDHTHPLSTDVEKLSKDFLKLEADLEKLESETRTALNAHQTVEKLLELHPYLEKHIPAQERAAKLPQVRPEYLESLIECVTEGETPF